MRLRFVRSALVGLVVAVAACGQPAPPTGPFDHLFAPPEGGFQHVSSTDTSGGNHDFVEIPAGDSAVLLDTSGPGIVRAAVGHRGKTRLAVPPSHRVEDVLGGR